MMNVFLVHLSMWNMLSCLEQVQIQMHMENTNAYTKANKKESANTNA